MAHGYDYAKHPVISGVNQARFKLGELSRLTKTMEKEKAISKAEYAMLRGKVPPVQKLMLAHTKAVQTIQHMSAVEKRMTQEQRRELIGAAIDSVSTITGIPSEFISDLVKVNWNPKSVEELVEAGATPQVRKTLSTIPPEELRQLHEYASKRITHDMLIQGNSLRVFTRAFPLMKEKIKRIDPELYKTYVGFSGALQLLNVIYEGKAEGAAVSAGKAEVKFESGKLKVTIPATSFPAVFNEITKAVYEALLYEGLPTREQIAGREAEFREITGDLELEFLHHKLAPRVSERMHKAFVQIVNANKKHLLEELAKRDLPANETYAVSMMYKAFAGLHPRITNTYVQQIASAKMDSVSRKAFTNLMVRRMEETI
jgi:hypothetical protein